MTLSLTLVSDDYTEALRKDHDRIAKTATTAMRLAGDRVKQEGRAAIAGGGFSSRWQNALRVKNYPEGGISGSPAVFVYHKIKYAGQFEDPQPVNGRPLIWLPIAQNLPGGRRWTPALFARTIGPLRGGHHGSRPILFGQVSVGRADSVSKYPKSLKAIRRYNARKTTLKWLPVFVGVSSIHDPKRFDISAVVERVSDQLGAIYAGTWESSS